MLSLTFSTRQEIMPKCPGLLEFTNTKRLCMVGNMTALCPELAPPGQTMYEAMACTRPSLGVFDPELERRLIEEDLLAHMPGYENATFVHYKLLSGAYMPASRCVPGTDATVRTPIANLFDVGDGVKRDGWTGTGSCALSAQEAVQEFIKDQQKSQVTRLASTTSVRQPQAI